MEAIYLPLPAENELEVTNFVGRFHIAILFDVLDVARDWLDVFDKESKKRLVDAVGFVRKVPGEQPQFINFNEEGSNSFEYVRSAAALDFLVDCNADLHAVSAKGETPDQILMRNKVDPEVIERLHQAQRGETRPDLSTLASYKSDPFKDFYADPMAAALIDNPAAMVGLMLGIARRARAGNMAHPS